jgi:hypothetical protein
MAQKLFLAALLLSSAFLWASGGKEQASPTRAPSAPKAETPTSPAAQDAAAAVTPAAQGEAPVEIPPTIGAVSYLDGGVAVTRDGKVLATDQVAIGLDVQNFDTVATAKDGTVEVEITSPVCPGAVLRVDPNTTFVLEVSRVGDSTNRSDYTVLRGSLGFKVKKITGNQEVVVRTDNSVLGVRGTEFRVVTTPTGDTLVTCREGSVEVRDAARSTIARPGTAVEKIADEAFRAIPVTPETADGFERSWYAGRIEALRANALRAIRSYAERYEQARSRFDTAFLSLVNDNADLIRKWIREDREGRVGTTAEQMSEKKQIVGSLFRVQRELVLLEPLWYRLSELQSYHEQGVGRGEVRPGLSTQDFFARLESDRPDIEQNLQYVRYTEKLYARRNGGTFPTAPGGVEGEE